MCVYAYAYYYLYTVCIYLQYIDGMTIVPPESLEMTDIHYNL